MNMLSFLVPILGKLGSNAKANILPTIGKYSEPQKEVESEIKPPIKVSDASERQAFLANSYIGEAENFCLKSPSKKSEENFVDIKYGKYRELTEKEILELKRELQNLKDGLVETITSDVINKDKLQRRIDECANQISYLEADLKKDHKTDTSCKYHKVRVEIETGYSNGRDILTNRIILKNSNIY